MTRSSAEARLADHLRPGMRLAVADGPGAPTELLGPLSLAAREVGGVSLVLGWCLDLPDDFDPSAFADVRTLMGGFALRDHVQSGRIRYVPERLRGIPALLRGPLRPDALLVGLRPSDHGWDWGTEVSWMAAVADLGVPLLVVDNGALPRTAREPGPPPQQVRVVATTHRPPRELPAAPLDEVATRIASTIAGLVPEGACLQVGPGAIGDAVLRGLEVPVRIRSGMVTEAVRDLDERGLLVDRPWGAYVAGSLDLYTWADERGVTARLERTHDLTAAEGRPWVAVNAALELDTTGAVNVEGAARHVSGIGGHPDFALLGHVSDGLSVVAVPSSRRGQPTLVDRLSGPASTARTDVDVVVTEHGAVDLRGLDDGERTAVLRALWARA